MFLKSSLHGVNDVRTKGQQGTQGERRQRGEPDMIHQIKTVTSRCDTLLADAVGVASLFVMMAVALHLPAMI